MIIYCGLRHFYLHHFKPPKADVYYILTHNKEIWDFSPELKDYGFSNQAKPQVIWHLEKPVLTVPIDLDDFWSFSQNWHDFSRQYTDDLEPEYPHAWYLRFKQSAILQQFIIDFNKKLEQEQGGIWGGGTSKLVAKLAAHNLASTNRLIDPKQTQQFLNQVPLHRLPLPELASLDKLGLKTIGEIANLPLVELAQQFGSRAPVLRQLGRGEDLVPFQGQPILEYSWKLDCTTLEGFLRPLAPHELKPYLQQGLTELASTLQAQHKVASLIKIEANLAEGQAIENKRQFKQATNDFNTLARAVDSFVPQEPLAQLNVLVGELKPAPVAQLNMFWEPVTPSLNDRELPAQIGVELSRRERLLILWEEYFEEESLQYE